MLQNFWYACEFSHAVTHAPKQIELWDQRIVLYRDDSDHVVALRDVCPHRGAALSLGKVHGDCIQCPYHGWQFQTDGTCTKIPSNPSHTAIPRRAIVKSYPVQEKYDFIWLFWGDLPFEKQPALPTIESFPRSSFRPIYHEVTIHCHYSRVFENLLDPAHSTFVHSDSFSPHSVADLPRRLAEIKFFPNSIGGSFYRIIQKTVPKWKILAFWEALFGGKKVSQTKSSTRFYLPNFIAETLDDKIKFRHFFVLCPVNNEKTIIKIISYRNFLMHPLVDGLFQKFTDKVFKEDQLILESLMSSDQSPDDLTAEIYVAGDAMTVGYRKLRKKYRGESILINS
ncbi:aromatic ring-hydroxylating dioxygenase subunit alpha [Leptothoe spongobia]|uniref:Aromatic ring-hydroxylating dioxygenase subunit alpha n=1 Tax=Leptothoe spongobia TAU-MAC 1115 TaxID=1967444 RepID=A0A947DCW2_9CYAN|nr:aromatic ring-hydroxylating dioxygenase subunit alpha [Leptothoe spongobia]MBT9314069.1 aromatic ring-hydroxylating dioxygenase subunit alpha [Leptothoe spongobia TAU-MAC 1115]